MIQQLRQCRAEPLTGMCDQPRVKRLMGDLPPVKITVTGEVLHPGEVPSQVSDVFGAHPRHARPYGRIFEPKSHGVDLL